jgi:hypothetical protein
MQVNKTHYRNFIEQCSFSEINLLIVKILVFISIH